MANFYRTIEEASIAARSLGITSKRDYEQRYRDDPLLPSSLSRTYKDSWLGYPDFFRRTNPSAEFEPYKTLAEATAAVKTLGIISAREYKSRYREDPKLRSKPEQLYKSEWLGYPSFFGRKIDSYYPELDQAKVAVQMLGISTGREYLREYKRDSRLPRRPEVIYESEWRCWEDFLSRKIGGIEKYKTLGLASVAVRRLGLKSQADYDELHSFDIKLPARPDEFYRNEWIGWDDFFDINAASQNFFNTFELARSEAQKLKVVSRCEYQKKIINDERFPVFPNKFYSEQWKGWRDYLEVMHVDDEHYNYTEARKVCMGLRFKSKAKYKRDCRNLDSRLPSNPEVLYFDDWAGWQVYLGTSFGSSFYTFEEAKRRVLEMQISTRRRYALAQREDPMLPSQPESTYRKSWSGWREFLSQNENKYYATIDLAREAVCRLGVATKKEYRERYIEDKLLPLNPHKIYSDDWLGYPHFLNKREGVDMYESIEQASDAAKRLGLLTKASYREGYKKDPKLPSAPDEVYQDSWRLWGWEEFLGTEKYSFKEAGQAARKLGITGHSEYSRLYRLDQSLPSAPWEYYRSEWQGWIDFLLPEKCGTLLEAKFAIKVLKIKTSMEYLKQYKNYSCLPAHPDRVFSDDWVDWYDFCDTPIPYTYEETRALVIDDGVKGLEDYKRFLAVKNDPRIPRSPATVYKDKWNSWYEFVNKPEPYKIKYIRAPYLAWAESIEQFLKVSRGGSNKELVLCRFVRDYIQKYELGYAPEVFFASAKVDLNIFEEFIYSSGGSAKRWLLAAAKEFADYVIRTKLTFEDEDTGERVVALGARNPFVSVSYDRGGQVGSSGETNKPALAYQHVQSMCNWIIPETALNFGDLAHLQGFDADWFEVDSKVLDTADPDCIFKSENGKTLMWFPGYWMHTYALASVPARGRQLAYVDSGEAEAEIPQFEGGKIVWTPNVSALAGMTKDQGFIKRYPGDNIGMRFTSNKTSVRSEGYAVPWIPEKLAVWIIRFRNWQSKYNPVTRPMPWIECVRTDLNEKQRSAKGENCFLFREFGEEECGNYSSRLRDRLAAALYHSQPAGLELAESKGKHSSLTTYSTPYSPHSMRVSLITAYVIEFGLPLDIVMKIAGHSSIIMSLYYVKLNAEGLRVKFAEGEKRALSNQVYATIQMLEQNRVDEIRSQLIQNNEEAILRYTGKGLPGSFLFRDYGFCPFAGTRCDDGGPLIGATQVRQPIMGGYLGMQNCLRCRHFVTGPVFIGGLLYIANEISLQAAIQFDHIADINSKIAEVSQAIEELDDAEYAASKVGEKFDTRDRTSIEMKARKLQSELESAAKKADLFLCDIQSVSRLINQSQAVLNEQVAQKHDDNLPQLIVQSGHELTIALEDSSRFHLLSEVCENAEIYEAASAELALPSRSQMLDRMIAFNNMTPKMYALDKQQQLVIGNQLTNFLLTRVKSWAKVDDLITGKLLLSDLNEEERIEPKEIKAILGGSKHAIASDMTMELQGGVGDGS